MASENSKLSLKISFLESLKNEVTSNYTMNKLLIILKALVEGRISLTSAYNEIGGGHN